jgi:hypothetical protein
MDLVVLAGLNFKTTFGSSFSFLNAKLQIRGGESRLILSNIQAVVLQLVCLHYR